MKDQRRGLGSRSVTFFLCLILTGDTVFAQANVDDGFALRDGDTVVFLGDSITAARIYGQVIETTHCSVSRSETSDSSTRAKEVIRRPAVSPGSNVMSSIVMRRW